MPYISLKLYIIYSLKESKFRGILDIAYII